VLFAIGLFARHWGSVLEAGLSIASVLYGALLGVFLLGLLTQRPGESAAIAGMVAGLVATFAVRGYVAFTWFVLVGSSVTFAVGWLAGFVFPRSPVRLDSLHGASTK
jgi:Na+/proline symporter